MMVCDMATTLRPQPYFRSRGVLCASVGVMPEIDLETLSTPEHGYTVDDSDDDDPVLLDRDGDHIDTWRERYPYDHRMPQDEYEHLKRRLQIELLKLQQHGKRNGARHVIVFEGRDAAGKGGTIKRFMEHLNPRSARVEALEKPSEREQTQWYFQRYIGHLPAGGEIVLFDRSWYNRAGVEKVMGFCTPEQHAEFLRQAPLFEEMLVNDGISLTKFWFSVSPAEQRTRFAIRLVDPGTTVEVFADRHGVAGQMGRLHRGEGGDVCRDRYRCRALDSGQEQ